MADWKRRGSLIAGLRRWWLRRFLGIVQPPAQYGGQGTTWQQHRGVAPHPTCYGNGNLPVGPAFLCKCGQQLVFTEDEYVIREQEHIGGCYGNTDISAGAPATDESLIRNMRPCSCPVTDARYVKICPHCHLGHWKQAL